MSETTGIRVLVIQPNRASRDAARVALESAGAQVDSVEDGAAGLALFDDRVAYVVDLILVGATLAGLDAFSTVKALKAGPAAGVAVYVVFSGESKRHEKRFREHGCDGWLDGERLVVKPLVERLRRCKEDRAREVAPAAWAMGDREEGAGYAVESMALDVWLAHGGAKGPDPAKVVEQWFEGPGASSDMFRHVVDSEPPDLGEDVTFVLPDDDLGGDDTEVIALYDSEPAPRSALVAVERSDAPAGWKGCVASAGGTCPHIQDVVVAATAAFAHEPGGPAGELVEGTLRKFIDAQLPTILASAIAHLQGSGATQQMNETFRRRVLGDVEGQLATIIREAERQAHAMAASVAHQALSDALPALHREMRYLIFGVCILGIAVAAGAVYIAVGA